VENPHTPLLFGTSNVASGDVLSSLKLAPAINASHARSACDAVSQLVDEEVLSEVSPNKKRGIRVNIGFPKKHEKNRLPIESL